MTARISKFTYGAFGGTMYKPSDPEHARRVKQSYIDAMGDRRIPDHFNIMLTRVRPAQSSSRVSY